MARGRPRKYFGNGAARQRDANRRALWNGLRPQDFLPQETNPVPPDEVLAECERARSGRKSLTQALMGDPALGRSALEKNRRSRWHIDEDGCARDPFGELTPVPSWLTVFDDYRPDAGMQIFFVDGTFSEAELRRRGVILKPLWELLHG